MATAKAKKDVAKAEAAVAEIVKNPTIDLTPVRKEAKTATSSSPSRKPRSTRRSQPRKRT
jgi:hypothetical protein